MYNGRLIGGLKEKEFREVLLGEHSSIRVRNSNRGLVILSNDAIIKCVSHYYATRSVKETKKRTKGSTHECYYVMKDFDIQGIELNNCLNCHIHCIDKRNKKELRRLIK